MAPWHVSSYFWPFFEPCWSIFSEQNWFSHIFPAPEGSPLLTVNLTVKLARLVFLALWHKLYLCICVFADMLCDDDTLMLMNWCLWCADVDDERMLLKHWCCWFTYASNVMMLLVRWSCWCTYHADVLTLLMCWSCWYADPADALILLIHWSCWSTDADDALMLLMCWCTYATESGSGLTRGPFYSNLL